eukprot:m.221775 g.221775  ORF g.221775 m.221775 type:complete len:3224 (+) comp17013_c0_seq1:75-9746(+)
MQGLRDHLKQLVTKPTKAKGETVINCLEDVQLCADLDEVTLSKNGSPTWEDIITPFLDLCGHSSAKGSTYPFDHLSRILGLADNRFDEHGATMMSSRFVARFIKKLLPFLEQPALVVHVVNLLIKRIFIHHAYVMAVSATLTDKLLSACLPAVAQPKTWDSRTNGAAKLVELFSWLLCHSPNVMRQRIMYSTAREKIEDAFLAALEANELSTVHIGSFQRYGTLETFLRSFRAYALLLAWHGQTALARRIFRKCHAKFLSMVKGSQVPPVIRSQAVHILRVFVSASQSADGRRLRMANPTDIVDLLAIARSTVLTKITHDASVDTDTHHFLALLADLLATTAAFSNQDLNTSDLDSLCAQRHNTGPGTTRPSVVSRGPASSRASHARPHRFSRAASVSVHLQTIHDISGALSVTERVSTSVEIPRQGDVSTTVTDEVGPPRQRAKRAETPIHTLFSWFEHFQYGALVVCTYLVERQAQLAGLPFLREALWAVVDVLSHDTTSNLNWGLRCAASLVRCAARLMHSSPSPFATSAPTSASAPLPSSNCLESTRKHADSVLQEPLMSLCACLERHLVGSANPSVNLQLVNDTFIALIEAAPACLENFMFPALLRQEPLHDISLQYLLAFLHTPNGHHQIITSDQVVPVAEWLSTSPNTSVFNHSLPSSWHVAICLSLLCRTKPPPSETLTSILPPAPTALEHPADSELVNISAMYMLQPYLSDDDSVPECLRSPNYNSPQNAFLIDQSTLNPMNLVTVISTLLATYTVHDSAETNLDHPQLLKLAWQAGVLTKFLALVMGGSSGLEDDVSKLDESSSQPGHESREERPAVVIQALCQRQTQMLAVINRQIQMLVAEGNEAQTGHRGRPRRAERNSSRGNRRGVSRLCCETGTAFLSCLLNLFVEDNLGFCSWRGERKPFEQTSRPFDACLNTVSLFLRTSAQMGHFREFISAMCSLTRSVVQLQALNAATDPDTAFFDDEMTGRRLTRQESRLTHEDRQLLASRLAPRHLVETVQVMCLDIIHCWRFICNHTRSQFRYDDATELLVGPAILQDPECPMLVALSACQSFAQVPPQDEHQRSAAFHQVLHVLCQPAEESNAVIADTAFTLAPCFNTVLDILTRLAPWIWSSSESPSVVYSRTAPHQGSVRESAPMASESLNHLKADKLLEWWRSAMPTTRPHDPPLDVSQRMAIANLVTAAVKADVPNVLATLSSVGAVEQQAQGNGSSSHELRYTASLTMIMALARDHQQVCRLHATCLFPLMLEAIAIHSERLLDVAFSALLSVIEPLFSASDMEDPYAAPLENLNDDDYEMEIISQHTSSLVLLAKIFSILPQRQPRVASLMITGAKLQSHVLVSTLFQQIARRDKFRSVPDMLEPLLPAILARWHCEPEPEVGIASSCQSPLKDTPYWTFPAALFDTEMSKAKSPWYKIQNQAVVLNPQLLQALKEFVRQHVHIFAGVILGTAPILSVATWLNAIATTIDEQIEAIVQRSHAFIRAMILSSSCPDGSKRDRLRKLREILGVEVDNMLDVQGQGQFVRSLLLISVPAGKEGTELALAEPDVQLSSDHLQQTLETPFISLSACNKLLMSRFPNQNQEADTFSPLVLLLAQHPDSLYDILVDMWDAICRSDSGALHQLQLRKFAFFLLRIMENSLIARRTPRHKHELFAPSILTLALEICLTGLVREETADLSLFLLRRLYDSSRRPCESIKTVLLAIIPKLVYRLVSMFHDLQHQAVGSQVHRSSTTAADTSRATLVVSTLVTILSNSHVADVVEQKQVYLVPLPDAVHQQLNWTIPDWPSTPEGVIERMTTFARQIPNAMQLDGVNHLQDLLRKWLSEDRHQQLDGEKAKLSLSRLLPAIEPMVRSHPETALQVAKCFGEAGMAWAYTPAEASVARADNFTYYSVKAKRISSILRELQRLVCSNEDSCVMIAALRALRDLVGSTEDVSHVAAKEFPDLYALVSKKTSSVRLLSFAESSGLYTTSLARHAPPATASTHQPSTVDPQQVWTPGSESYAAWLTQLVCTLIQHTNTTDESFVDQYTPLIPVCQLSLKFCEFIFPYVVLGLVMYDPQQTNSLMISKNLNHIFANVTPDVSPESRRCIQTLLKLVNTLRNVEYTPSVSRGDVRAKEYISTSWDSLRWLKGLDYLQVAHAAYVCDSKYSAVLYCEIAAEMPPEMDTQRQRQLRAIISAALQGLHEPDDTYAFMDPLDMQQHLQVYAHEHEYGKLLAHQDILGMASPDAARSSLLTSAHRWGLVSIPRLLCQSSSAISGHSNPEETAYMFEAAWRLGDWDAIVPTQSDVQTIDKHIFTSLRTMRTGIHGLEKNIEAGCRETLARLMRSGPEDVQAIHQQLVSLQMLRELDEATELLNLCSAESLAPRLEITLQQWQHRLDRMPQAFDARERVISLRLALLDRLVDFTQESPALSDLTPAVEQHFQECVVEGLALCRRFEKYHQALTLSHKLDIRSQRASTIPKRLHLLETAKTLWNRNDSELAVQTLKAILAESKLSEASRLLGTWTGELRSETPAAVIGYFRDALRFAEGDTLTQGWTKNQAQILAEQQECWLALARYTDQQYLLLTEKMSSSDHAQHLAIIEQNREEVRTNRDTSKTDDAVRRRVRLLQRRLAFDDASLKGMRDRQFEYLTVALDNYLKALQHATRDYHDIIFRVCSLWFNNTGLDMVQDRIEKHASSLPSYQWLPLIYQLAARLDTPSNSNNKFQAVLQRLLLHVALSHPHHVLFVLLALANGEKQTTLASSSSRTPMTSKMQAANSLLRKISEYRDHPSCHGRDMGMLVNQMRAVSSGYTELANLEIPDRDKQHPERYRKLFGLARLNNVSWVAVLTAHVPVDPSGEYPADQVVRIEGWADAFTFAGGINLPRILNCRGSDGRWYKEVIKGNDDSRQDAVMQQVFGMMNKWLMADPECQRRAMQIRTYKIVPLSSTVGVLEWCTGTVPLGGWLVKDDKAAHERYMPGDWANGYCRAQIKKVRSKSPAERLQMFQAVCEHFHPVMRRFFTENFRDPGEWFERRLAYTRSVATNSMVGYIIGLGDRHPNNILIDTKTAELVHIDLGVAFEQGRLLPTPETIPFRLTRDIIDGMGLSGVEGTFRRCCEKCMVVLRKSAAPLGTILEVFVHDPLSTWKLTHDKAKAVQKEQDTTFETTVDASAVTESVEENEAQKVLIKVRQKLSGFHDGIQLSVQGHVGALIQEATDEHRLSRLFEGWQAWV